MTGMTWLEALHWTTKHELEVKRYQIEVQALADYLADAPPLLTSTLELDRRAYRAEAECASLRLLVKRLADALEAVPEKDTHEMRLIDEARKVHP